MKLVCKSQFIGDVVVVRCEGRIVAGEEAQSLRQEIEKLLLETRKFVLHLGGVAYIDSGGLGAMVRLLGTLRADRGDLKLCELSPFLMRVFEATDLNGMFHTYPTEREAIEAFSRRPEESVPVSRSSRPKVICVDSSSDLLAYLSAILKRCNYQVYTTKHLSDATTLVRSTHPRVAICGPATQESVCVQAFEKFRQADPAMQILILPPDFQASEAGQAGTNLVEQIGAMISAPE
jgi:anti-anti-sigma factor